MFVSRRWPIKWNDRLRIVVSSIREVVRANQNVRRNLFVSHPFQHNKNSTRLSERCKKVFTVLFILSKEVSFYFRTMATLPTSEAWHEATEDDLNVIYNCYCPNCEGGKGKTLMLPTKVPGFREIIVASFDCPDCSFRNAEVTFGGEIQPYGSRLTLMVVGPEDLNRQVLKSDSAAIILPKLELEIPPNTQRGTLSTLEGMLSRAEENLSMLQPERLKLGDVDNFHRCQKVIDTIKRILGKTEEEDDDDEKEEPEESLFPFEFILDDIAGNSYIENPHAPKPDPNLKQVKYDRTPMQDMALGLQPAQAAVEAGTIEDSNPKHKNVLNKAVPHSVTMDNPPGGLGRQEVLKFPTTCSHCYKPAETDMCVTDIPHFKEVIIMSLVCDHCGFRSNEIKGGGSIPKYGCKITLQFSCR